MLFVLWVARLLRREGAASPRVAAAIPFSRRERAIALACPRPVAVVTGARMQAVGGEGAFGTCGLFPGLVRKMGCLIVDTVDQVAAMELD